jgi:hypothetical protein
LFSNPTGVRRLVIIPQQWMCSRRSWDLLIVVFSCLSPHVDFGEVTDLLHLEGSTLRSLQEVCRKTACIRRTARASQFLGTSFVNTRPTSRLSFKHHLVSIVKIRFNGTISASRRLHHPDTPSALRVAGERKLLGCNAPLTLKSNTRTLPLLDSKSEMCERH